MTLHDDYAGPCDPLLGGRADVLKSELVVRIADQNPHLSTRDVEKLVDAILNDGQARPSGGARLWGISCEDLAGSGWAQSEDQSQNQCP
jgi:hypothetical protein